MKVAHGLTDEEALSPKRPRRTYEDWELSRLEAEFSLNSYPSREHRNGLAREMDVSPKQIQIWFQNRRARARTMRRKADGIVENPIERMKIQWTSSTFVSTANNLTGASSSSCSSGSKNASVWTVANDENRPPVNQGSSNIARTRVPSTGSRCSTADLRISLRNSLDISNSSFSDLMADVAATNRVKVNDEDDDDLFTETFLTLFSPNYQSHATYDF